MQRSLVARSSTGLLLALLFLWASLGRAQRAIFDATEPNSGLTNLNITALVQDRAGVIWVGTQNGVFKANGAHYERQPEFDRAGLSLILAMHIDEAGRIWAASASSFGYLDATGVHRVFGLANDSLNDQNVYFASLPREPDRLFVSKDGRLTRFETRNNGRSWSATAVISDGSKAEHPELANITSIGVSQEGELWAGCGTALCQFSHGFELPVIWSAKQGVPPDRRDILLFTRSGALWARGQHSIVRLEPNQARFTTLEPLPRGYYLNVQEPSMVEDPSGHVLLNLSRGIAREEDGHWHVLTTGQGLPNDQIDLLYFDGSGLPWLALDGHGIAHWLGYGNWESWTEAEGLSSNTIWSIAKGTDERLWVGTEAGLDRLTPLSGEVRRSSPGFDFRRAQSLAVDDRGHLWCGDGLGRLVDYDPKRNTVRKLSGFGHITQILLDRSRRLWVASRNGIAYLDEAEGWRTVHQAGPDGAQVSADIAEGRDGTLWFSTEKGLYRLRGSEWAHIELPPALRDAVNFPVTAAQDGTLWIADGLEEPVHHLRVRGQTAVEIESVSTRLLGTNSIVFVNFDQRGWLWVGTDVGVSVYDGHRWIRCTREDGLAWDDTNSFAFLADPDGSVWIGTTGGLAHLRHPESLFRDHMPAVTFANVRLGDQLLHQDDGGPALQSDLRRPALTAELLNTDYSRPTAVAYRYRLNGLEGQWLETSEPSLRFPVLGPGPYSLSVVAYDRRLHVSSAPATVSFELLPPWWQRFWFRMLTRAGVLLVLVLVWRGSVRILVARQHELEAQVLERTGELEKEKAELLAARANLIEMTRRDGLTGLLNRTAIFEKMAEECQAAQRTGEPLAVVMADLDRFKSINDSYGHVVGDTVIRHCAERIRMTIRPGDSVGRYGGEELLILMPGLNPGSARTRLEELRCAIASEPITHGGLTLWITCSFGVAWLGGPASELESLVAMADAALYRAKERGRNCYEFGTLDLVPGPCDSGLTAKRQQA